MRITIFGDTMCKKEYLQMLKQRSEEEISKSFSAIKDIIDDSDYTMLNLETPVSGEEYGCVSEKFCFNAPIEFAQAIKNIGVDLVLMANNHILDRGVDGLRATIENLRRCSLDFLGIHEKKEPSYKIISLGDLKIGLVNFTYGTNAFSNHNYLKRNECYMIDLLQKQELHNKFIRKLWNSKNKYIGKVKRLARHFKIGQFDVLPYERREKDFFERRRFMQAIKNVKREGADYVIVMPHVGGQYNERPSDYTKEICHLAIKSGADAVIANHEHVIHNVELRKNRIIAYSIGNFFSTNGVLTPPYNNKTEYSMAIHIDFKNGRIEYYFSIYKNILKNNSCCVVGLYDLINDCERAEEKEKLILDNEYFVRKITGSDKKNIEVEKFYRIF